MSGITILLVLGIVFLVGVLFVRNKPPEVQDQVADAVTQLYDMFGFQVTGTMDARGGLVVEKVKPGSPADQLGIKAGDRFVAVNDRSIWHAKDMLDQATGAMNTGPVSFLVERDGDYRQVIVGGRRSGMAGAPSAAGRRGAAGAGTQGASRGGRRGAPAGALRGPGTSQPGGDGGPSRGR